MQLPDKPAVTGYRIALPFGKQGKERKVCLTSCDCKLWTKTDKAMLNEAPLMKQEEKVEDMKSTYE